jgi:hypothetical protein
MSKKAEQHQEQEGPIVNAILPISGYQDAADRAMLIATNMQKLIDKGTSIERSRLNRPLSTAKNNLLCDVRSSLSSYADQVDVFGKFVNDQWMIRALKTNQ